MAVTLPTPYGFLWRFYRLAIANIVSNIMVPLAGTLSLAFLGHLADIRELGGVTLASLLFNYLYLVLKFLRMGTTGVTAQAVGADDREEMLLVGLRNGLIALGLGVLILILQYPLHKLGFTLLSGTPEVKASGLDYFNARIWGAPAVLLNYVLIGWFLGREMSGKVFLLFAVGYGANVALDYMLIIRWGWASTGAGLGTAMSQYLMLFLGLILVSWQVSWKEVRALAGKLWNVSAMKATFGLNGNILLRSLALIFTYSSFLNVSSTIETSILVENALMLQLLSLVTSCVDGIGLATETLSGNFKGKRESDRLLFLLQIAVGTSLVIAFIFSLVCVLFPQFVFGLLTNHDEVIELMKISLPGFLMVVGLGPLSFLLEGYFLGLAEGSTVRNATLVATLFGFSPLAFSAWYFHNNYILWLSMIAFMVTRVVMFGVQLPRTFSSLKEDTVSPRLVENKGVSE